LTPLIEEFANAAARGGVGAMRVSVLIPFHRDDPTALLHALAIQAPREVEIVLFDDGAPDPALNAAVRAAAASARPAVRVLTAKTNLGRSAARNRLAARARGAWLLFIDADMAIEDGFLSGWLAQIARTTAKAVFGGYQPAAPASRSERLHAALAHASDVRDAQARSLIGAVAVCSSNLAVHAPAFAERPFDEGFSGWGWEDVDWALTFSKRFPVAHVDQPARHGGLESPPRLLAKFEKSGPNFARLMARHPDYAARKGARLALAIKRLGLIAAARPAGRAAALAPIPMRLRVAGVKLFRAAVAAQALP
jgi:hypothetical protein